MTESSAGGTTELHIQVPVLSTAEPSTTQNSTTPAPAPTAHHEEPVKTPHVVFLNDAEKNKKKRYPSNYIRTTKYTLLTFIPLFLWDQFKRYYNIFFVAVMICSLIPGVSPTTPITSVIPVVFILGSALLREVYEDIKRFIADVKANRKQCVVVRHGKEETINSASVKVGDFVKVFEGEEFPADLLAIASSDKNGVCKIETASLDGETNTKIKKACKATLHITTPEDLTNLKGQVNCQKANPKLTQFVASMSLEHIPQRPKSSHHEFELPEVDVSAQTLQPPTKPAHHRRTSSLLGGTKKTVVMQEGVTMVPVDIDNLLLRGASLVSTEWVYGLVLYAGRDTKLMKNFKKGKSKFSYLDQTLNSFLIFLILFHQLCTIVSIILAIVQQNTTVMNSFYVKPYNPKPADFIWIVSTYLTQFILFNLFIPMSLFVSLEFVKTIQLRGMDIDKKMWDSDVFRFKGNTSSLNADLSQVSIIFSDKTGTLTQNEMVFKKCAVKGQGTIFDEAKEPGIIRKVIFNDEKGSGEKACVTGHHSLAGTSEQSNFQVSNSDRYWLTELILCLALCHSIVPETDKTSGKIKYEGESPDEVALIDTAARCGMVLLEKSDTHLLVKINDDEDEQGGDIVRFDVLLTLSFTSERARSSVVVRRTSTTTNESKIIVYSKGADSKLLPRLKDGSDDPIITKLLLDFALDGLRTLLLTRRVITQEFWNEWDANFAKVLNNINADEKTRKANIEACANILENEYELIGATAIEDKLQDKVPESVEFFREAGIQMWMLTGDKHETAENIAMSAKMIDKSRQVVKTIVGMKSFDETLKTLDQIYSEIKTNEAEWKKTHDRSQAFDVALIIDGQTLNYVFGDASAMKRKPKIPINKDALNNIKQRLRTDSKLDSSTVDFTPISATPTPISATPMAPAAPLDEKAQEKALIVKQKACFEKFVLICKYCGTVIVCRSSPSQKALMVRMVSKKYGKIGLAVGDGLNDVSMIQEARVGVGIMGKEGSQASRAADYSIPSFKHLKRLLVVHGRYSLWRTASFVQYSFYKNTTLVFVQILYGFFCLFTGQTIVDSWVITLYNTIFTIVPPFVMGLFDRDVHSGRILERHPEVYREFKTLHLLNWISFFKWFINALYHSLVIFFFTYAAMVFSDQSLSYQGFKQEDLWSVSGTIGLTVVVVVNLKALFFMTYYPPVSSITMFLSFVSIYISHFIYTAIPGTQLYYVIFILFTSPKFYLIHFLCIVACLLPDLTIQYIKKFFFPSKWEILFNKYNSDPKFKKEMKEKYGHRDSVSYQKKRVSIDGATRIP